MGRMHYSSATRASLRFQPLSEPTDDNETCELCFDTSG